MKRTWWAAGVGLVALALVAGGPGRANATLEMQKQAKTAGVAVANCQHCHVDKLPMKDAYTLNDVGKWMVDEKQKRKAKEADGAWLKAYKK